MTTITLFDEATGEDRGTVHIPSDTNDTVFIPVND